MSGSPVTPLGPLPKSKYELEFNHGSEYGEEERDAILRVFSNNAPSCGAEVLSFEREFSSFVGSAFAVAVGNATQGLEIAVRTAMKSAEGRGRCEVIVPSVSWISTASSAALAGATVKFADVMSPTVCVDPESIKRLITEKTAAVVVVHLYGRPVDGLLELAQYLKEREILLIEDCAHSVGSRYASGESCGNVGDIGVFSFHQQKNMVTLGEGGMCVTSNPLLHQLLVGYRSLCAMSYDPKGKYLAMDSERHPMGKRYWLMDFVDHGHNFRMLDMQAAVGRIQLKKVIGWNARRAEIANRLVRGLAKLHPGLVVPEIKSDGMGQYLHSWHLFHILITDEFPLNKEDFMWEMIHTYNIKPWNHYSPMHLATSFKSNGLGKIGDCPVAESLFEQYVSLPIHPRLTDEAVDYMIRSISELAALPHRPRSTPAPLLTALDALSSSDNSQIASINNSRPAIVETQLSLFIPQVHQALQDGFFSSSRPTLSSPQILLAQPETLRGNGVCIARAPGRLDLMGGNDDYTGGLVFECTIAEATFVAAQAMSSHSSSAPMIKIRNKQLVNDDFSIPVSVLQEPNLNPSELAAYLRSRFPDARWPLYAFGVLLYLQMHFPGEMFSNGRGLGIMIWGQIPLNRGVSSSASVEVAVMKASAAAFGIDIFGETLATACQWVENEVCSSACGLMDQMAVTLGSPFMAMQCQPACIRPTPSIPEDLTVFALDSGVSHEISGIEYEAARAAAFMGYKIICQMEGLSITEERVGPISRYSDPKYKGYLANMSPSVFQRRFENALPVTMTGQSFLDQYGEHVDPATNILPGHSYSIRANTKYAVMENYRVSLFYQLMKGGEGGTDLYIQLGELMYQSHDAYTECGLGSNATSHIVELVRALGPESGLFGAKITGGGAGGTVAILGLSSAKETFDKVVSAYAVYAQQRGIIDPPYVFAGSSPGADRFGIMEL